MKIDRCNVEGCRREAQSRGMCPKHYQAWRRAHPNETTKRKRHRPAVVRQRPSAA